MIAKLYASFLLFAVCAQYVELKTGYCLMSTKPKGGCLQLDFDVDAISPVKCDRRWRDENGEAQSDTFFLNYVDGDDIKHYDVVDPAGTFNGTKVDIQYSATVYKFTVINEDGSIDRNSCLLDNTPIPNEEEARVMMELCHEENQLWVDYNNCASIGL